MIKIALALYPALISRNMHHADITRHSRITRTGREGTNGPGKTPGPFG